MTSNYLTSFLALPSTRRDSLFNQPLWEVLRRAGEPLDTFDVLADVTNSIIGSKLESLVPSQSEFVSTDAESIQILEHERSDVASVARFGQRVDRASYCLYVAFDKAKVDDFELSIEPPVVTPRRGVGLWYSNLFSSTLHRYSDMRRALLHPWTPPAEVELLTSCAFSILSHITPAESQLRNLFASDRSRAFRELTHHLDLYVNQLKAAIELSTDLDAAPDNAEQQAQAESVQKDLLAKAGNALSLTEAAGLLEVSRQALHKRIGLGTALGMMHCSELVVPDAQFVMEGEKLKIVDGLSGVVRLFDTSGAGRWSALQFLIEKDPNLGVAPFDALKAGKRDAVIGAARAFLVLDEG